jgi:hypothetical protein
MVTGKNLSSRLLKAGSAADGFRLHLAQRPLSLLSENEFIRFDVDTPTRRRHGLCVIHRRRARLEDERPQLGEFLTPVVKIGKSVPAKDGFADPIASPGQSPAKAGSESGTVPAGVIAIPRGANLLRQIPFGRVAFHHVMAADEIERADEAAVAPAIAQAAFDPALAVAKEPQKPIENFDGFGWVARAHEITPPHPG